MNWRCEAYVYESTLLAHLPPGMTILRSLGIEKMPDDSIWIWLDELGLEQVVDGTPI